MTGPAAGRVAQLENRVLDLTREKESLARDRERLAKANRDLGARLAQAKDRAEGMAARIAEMARIEDAARERALAAESPYESTATASLAIVKALRDAPSLTREDLRARLVDSGFTAAGADEALRSAERLQLVVEAPGGRLALSRPASADAR